MWLLLVGKRDPHGIRGSDLEALQSVLSSTSLHFILKLHKGNVMPTWHQTHFFESREPEKREGNHCINNIEILL